LAFLYFRCIIVKIRKIESGLYAASGKGQQSPIIISVTNKELRDKLSRMNCEIGGWKEGFDPFFNAPVVLIVLAPKDWANKTYDGSLVMGNMMLAAHTLNIGGDEYRQHNPMVADGKAGIIEYFTRMKREYPIKKVRFVRAIAQGDLVALHTHQIWGEPDNKEYVTMDFFRFNENNKIVEHWDSIQEVIKDTKSGRTMY